MPHLLIEYSANMDTYIDVGALVDAAHRAVIEAGPFAIGGIRTRAARRQAYAVADQHPDNSFVHLTLTIGSGRPTETIRAAGDAVFEAVTEHLAPVLQGRPVAVSFYILEADPELSWKRNTVHEAVAAREVGT